MANQRFGAILGDFSIDLRRRVLSAVNPHFSIVMDGQESRLRTRSYE